MTVQIEQKPAFKRVYKKLHANQRDAIHEAIRAILADP
jgi:mRNA-degrading endonuclease RelE of RelBE toxin-antitoxin system